LLIQVNQSIFGYNSESSLSRSGLENVLILKSRRISYRIHPGPGRSQTGTRPQWRDSAYFPGESQL